MENDVEVEVDVVVVGVDVTIVLVNEVDIVTSFTPTPAIADGLDAATAMDPAATAMIMNSTSDCFNNLLHQSPKDRRNQQYEHREKAKSVNTWLRA